MLGTESVYSVQPVKPFLMGCYACTAVAPVRRSQGAPYAHQRPFPKQVLLQMSPVVARVPDMYPVSHCRSRFYSFETTLAVRSTTTCVLAADSQAALGTPPVCGWHSLRCRPPSVRDNDRGALPFVHKGLGGLERRLALSEQPSVR
jgi:hypothetical protein